MSTTLTTIQRFVPVVVVALANTDSLVWILKGELKLPFFFGLLTQLGLLLKFMAFA